jgi:hypothetical protein
VTQVGAAMQNGRSAYAAIDLDVIRSHLHVHDISFGHIELFR